MKHKWIIAVLAVALVGVAWFEHRTGIIRGICTIFGTSIKEDLQRESFDSAAWKSPKSTSGDYSLRSRMVDDLLSRHHLVGRNRNQVIALLGKPDLAVGNEFRYTLGWERGWLKIDGEDLVIAFDSSGVDIKAETSVN